MFLREFFKKSAPIINEGGNALINGEMADRIDSNARAEVIPILTVALNDINNSFKSFSGKDLWSPKLLASRKFLSGSSFHFFDRENISDLEFHEAKPTVGDIDTQVDKDLRETIIEWLKSIPLKSKIGDAVYVGLKGTEPGEEKHLAGGQLITLWNFPNIEIEMEGANGIKTRRGTNIQIDLELKTFETPAGQDYAQPTRWSLFSASSAWEDLKLGIKGVFHKYLIQSMTTLTSKEVIVRKPKYNRKTKSYDSFEYSEAKYRNLFTFAVSSKEGGGLRTTYEPIMLDKDTQETMNGLPLYQEKGTTGYEQDVDQIFANIFGDRVSIEDVKKYGTKLDSFVGLLDILNTVCNDDEKIKIRDRFISKCLGFEEGRAQELDAINPGKDRNDKLAAINLLVLKLKVQLPDNFDTIVDTYYQNYKIRQPTNEQAEPSAPSFTRKGVPHIYAKKPDGTPRTVEMKDLDFLELCKELSANGGTFDNIQINEKIDGSGIRFGKDQNGRPFFMAGGLNQIFYADNVGWFEQNSKTDPERAKSYDQALSIITNSKFIQTLPDDMIVQSEMLFDPEQKENSVDGFNTFVNISYNTKLLGRTMTLSPFSVKQYSTGLSVDPQVEKQVIQKLVAASDPNIKIISNSLEQKGINVSNIIKPVLDNYDEYQRILSSRKKSDAEAKLEVQEKLNPIRKAVSDTVINSPKLKGLGKLGEFFEGVVINMPGGPVKVTSAEMKTAMEKKMENQFNKTDQTPRVAVVALGSMAGHKGHEQLINFTIDKAKQLNGKAFIYVGSRVGPEDPIPVEMKLDTLHKIFGPNNDKLEISAVQDQTDASGMTTKGTHFKKIEKELVKKRPFYNQIYVMVGSDYAATNDLGTTNTSDLENKDTGMATQANTLQARLSSFSPTSHVKIQLVITPRGEDEGGTGKSTSALRQSLTDEANGAISSEEAFNVWRSSFSDRIDKQWLEKLMAASRENMQLSKSAVQPQTPAVPAATQQPASVKQNATPATPVDQPTPVQTTQSVQEKMAPRSHFAGKWKLGPAAHLKGNMKRPARQGDLVGGAESIDHKQIPIGENYEQQMSKLIKLLEKKYGH